MGADTETILEHHISAFLQHDLPEILNDYTDDSVIVTNQGTFSERSGIKRLFDDLFADFSQDGATVDVTQKTVRSEFAYIVWHAETPEYIYECATCTFYIPDDTIVFQTLTAEISSKDEHRRP